jgi:3'(2'), 5'-bisphosphate nucleotidase
MPPSENRQLAEALLKGVLAAGRCQMSHFHSEVFVERKADTSPVTAADRDSEHIILDALQRVAPGVPVVAEEAQAAGRRVAIGDQFFLVDPLDGTKQFIRQIPEFTINIALIDGGVPVFGLIYAPVLGELYVTLDRGGSVETRIAPESDGVRLSDLDLKPLRVREADFSALAVVISRSLDPKRIEPFLKQFGVQSRMRMGSSLKFTAIARGLADVYVRPGATSEWDTAAGQAVLVAAGGAVTDFAGQALRYGNCERKFANPHFIAGSERLVKSADPGGVVASGG